MNIIKESQGGQETAVTQEDLALINAMARKKLTQQEIYTFSVRLCDNQVDRDFERFPQSTLEQLATLFVGKSGIFDHQWSARGQAARIYKTEVIHQPEQRTQAGDGCCWLKGYAYMVRTASTQDLIAEIEAGIKKEVSVGCAVERSVCSICGAELRGDECGHKMGEYYEGKLCFASLEGALDAYEFSFVAVPAQPLAGVVKGAGGGCANLKALTAGHPDCQKQLNMLEEQAALGRQYLSKLKDEVVRLGLLCQPGMSRDTLKAVADQLSWQQLGELKQAYAQQSARQYPLQTQLDYTQSAAAPNQKDGAFLI